jgi:hypothetical protein
MQMKHETCDKFECKFNITQVMNKMGVSYL